MIVRTNGSQLLFSLLLSLVALIAGKSYYNTERVEMEAADWLAGGERPASQL